MVYTTKKWLALLIVVAVCLGGRAEPALAAPVTVELSPGQCVTLYNGTSQSVKLGAMGTSTNPVYRGWWKPATDGTGGLHVYALSEPQAVSSMNADTLSPGDMYQVCNRLSATGPAPVTYDSSLTATVGDERRFEIITFPSPSTGPWTWTIYNQTPYWQWMRVMGNVTTASCLEQSGVPGPAYGVAPSGRQAPCGESGNQGGVPPYGRVTITWNSYTAGALAVLVDKVAYGTAPWEPPVPGVPVITSPAVGAVVTDLSTLVVCATTTEGLEAENIRFSLGAVEGSDPAVSTVAVSGGQACWTPSGDWRARQVNGFFGLSAVAVSGDGAESAPAYQEINYQLPYDMSAGISFGVTLTNGVYMPTSMPQDIDVWFTGSAYQGKTFSVFIDGALYIEDETVPAWNQQGAVAGVRSVWVNLSEGYHTITVELYIDAQGTVARKSLEINFQPITLPPPTCHEDTTLGMFEKAMCWAFVPKQLSLDWHFFTEEMRKRVPTTYVMAVVDGIGQFKAGAELGWTKGWKMPFPWWDGKTPPGVAITWVTIDIGPWAIVYDTTRLISKAVFLWWLLIGLKREYEGFISA